MCYQKLLKTGILRNLVLLLFGLILAGQIFSQLPDNLPDLVVSNLNWEPEDPQVGDSVWFTAEISNIGEGASPADKTHGVRFRVDDGTFGFNADHKTSMKPGDVFYASPDPESNDAGGYWIITTPGEYEISIEIDDYCVPTQSPDGPSYCTENIDPKCENRICESNEKNNFYYQTFKIEGTFDYKKKPDLIITSISMKPENPNPGDDVVFSAVVENQGDTVATSETGYFGVNFMFRETRVTRTAFDAMATSLNPGESILMTANWSLVDAGANDGAWKAVAGDTVLTAMVDKDDGVKEFIETNNTYNKTLYIGVDDSIKMADLIVGDIYFNPPDPVPNQAIFFSADIINQGYSFTKALEDDHIINMEFLTTGISVSRTIHDEWIKDSVPAGDTIRIYGNQTDFDLERDGSWYSKNPGDFTIICIADVWPNLDSGKIAESDEANNTFSKRLTIMNKADPGPLPDLEIMELLLKPAEPEPGDSILFTLTVKNSGTAKTPDNRLHKAKITVFDTILYAKSYESLNPGETKDFDFDKIRVPDPVQNNLVTVAVDTFPWFSIIETTKENNIVTEEISNLETKVEQLQLNQEVNIFPNPAVDHIYIKINSLSEHKKSISILNLEGQVVYSDVFHTNRRHNQFLINTSDLIPGMYFLLIDTCAYKLIINR
jgi:subtilase family serine protease